MTDQQQKASGDEIIVVVDEDLRDLIPGYLENRGNDVVQILSCLEQGDYETIRSLGHKMKGSGGGYGFDAVTEIGRTIEEAAKQSQEEVIRRQTKALQDYLQNIKVVFQPS
jgi:HPt (histidine-containing phosphotransfer) domain-containing protein